MTYFVSYHAKTLRGDFGFGNMVLDDISMNTENDIKSARDTINKKFLQQNTVGVAQITILNFIPLTPEATTPEN